MQSIIQYEKQCLVCGTTQNLHSHHIFGNNPNRRHSEKYGLKVFLCYPHHNGSDKGVHFDKTLDTTLKIMAQRKFEEVYPELNFVEIFGKSYL